MPEIHGLGQVITHWFAKHALSGFEFVNREQDLGIPGLRQAKESYYPHHMVEKIVARRRGGDESTPGDPHECDRRGVTP